MSYPLPKFSDETIQKTTKALIKAARWLQANQVWHEWPYWTADAGRFNSLINIKNPSIKPLLSICWNTARAAQALLSAYKVTGEGLFLETAKRAAGYVKTCQVLDPEFPDFRGACREETPLSDHMASRDTVEAIQAFINLYSVTQDRGYLNRACLSADWLVAQHIKEKRIPPYDIWFKDGRRW